MLYYIASTEAEELEFFVNIYLASKVHIKY